MTTRQVQNELSSIGLLAPEHKLIFFAHFDEQIANQARTVRKEMISKARFFGIRIAATLGVMACLLFSLSTAAAKELTALTESLPPLTYEVHGKVTGFASDLLDLMAKDAGMSVNKRLLPWPRAYEMTRREKGTVLYMTVRSPEREPLFQWVGPIIARRIQLFKHSDRADISLKTLEDARAYSIGTTHESTATKNLINQGFEIKNGKEAKVGLDIALNDEMNMRKFVAKRFDLLLSLDWAAAYNSKNADLSTGDIQVALTVDESHSYWYAINLETDPEVAKKLNAALLKIRNDGRYQKLTKKYLPTAFIK